MPYFNNNTVNLLFIHIPKTGGSSLEQYFSHKFNIQLNNKSLYRYLDTKTQLDNNIVVNSSLQHITYQTAFKYNTFFNINYDNITIITSVRNPYERIISDLFFFKKITINTSTEEVYNIIKTYLLATNLDNHNIPQYMFITNDKKELVPNIQLLRCETLTADMNNLGYADFNTHIQKNTIKHKNINKLNLTSRINNFY